MQPIPVSWTAANARRMDRQGLLTPASTAGTSPADIAGRMLGAHAQVMSAAELSLALRLDGATRTDVRDALTGGPGPAHGPGPGPRPRARPGTLVKTFGPRGTVHLLPAQDLPWWTGALSALPARPGTLSPEARMTAAQTDEVLAAIGDALTGAELTVDELTEAIVARTGSWAADPVMPAFQTLWPRWRQVTHTAAQRGVLAFGRDRGRKVTYTNPGCTPAPPRSLHELVNRYLRAYGPATAEDFAAWLAAPKGWAAALFASLAERAASRPWPSRPAAHGSPPATPSSRTNPRVACGCCPTSTRTPSPAAPANCSSPALRPPAPWRAARPATTPSSWSTARSPVSGTSAVRAAASR